MVNYFITLEYVFNMYVLYFLLKSTKANGKEEKSSEVASSNIPSQKMLRHLTLRPLLKRYFSTTKITNNSSIDRSEVKKFTATSNEWWGDDIDADADSSSAVGPLRKMNPVRCQFIRRWTDVHYGKHDALQGLNILDVGCGGGLLSETLARAGANVTGVDASKESILAAKQHYETIMSSSNATLSESMTGTVNYREDVQSVEALLESVGPNTFDIVCALEVIEHVPRSQQAKFVQDCRSLVKDDGCMFISTLNRTARSLALAIFGAEMVLRMVPPGTHDWGKFVTVDEMRKYVGEEQRQQQQVENKEKELSNWSLQIASGMQFNPIQNAWFENELDTEVNYITYSARDYRR